MESNVSMADSLMVIDDEKLSIARSEDIAIAIQSELSGVIVITGSSALHRYGLKAHDGKLKDLD
ncbi:hypothetical protein EOM86_03535, partial [Candidatus Nomurabacteria bacterium]|nr:hypothetical protein [Candidatus Nomurabacteria bacterium]